MTVFLFFIHYKDVDFYFLSEQIWYCFKLLVRDDAREGKSTLATPFAVLTKAVLGFRYKSDI